MPHPLDEVEFTPWGKKVNRAIESMDSGDWNGQTRRNGSTLKTILIAVIGVILTALITAVGWMIGYMLDTRTIANLNTASAAQNISAMNSFAMRLSLDEAEIRRIGLIQAERTSTVQRMQQMEDRKR